MDNEKEPDGTRSPAGTLNSLPINKLIKELLIHPNNKTLLQAENRLFQNGETLKLSDERVRSNKVLARILKEHVIQ